MTGSSYPAGAGIPGTSTPGAGAAQWPGMTIGEILDRVFRLLRAHLKLYTSLAMVPAVGVLGMMIVMGGLAALMIVPYVRSHSGSYSGPPSFWFLLWLAPLAFVLYIAVFILYSLYGAAASYAVVRTNRGQPATSADAWAVARKGAGRYIWLTFLTMLIIAGPLYVVMGLFAGVFGLAGIAGHSEGAPLIAFAFMPIFMLLNLGAQVYMVLMFLRFGLAFPACVMEDLPAVEALKRSVALTHGAKGRIFVVLLVMYAANFIAILVCEMVLFLVGGMGVLAATLAQLTLHSPVLLYFFAPLGLVLLLAVLLLLFSLPYAAYSTAFGVLYCDQQLRVDGVAAQPATGRSA